MFSLCQVTQLLDSMLGYNKPNKPLILIKNLNQLLTVLCELFGLGCWETKSPVGGGLQYAGLSQTGGKRVFNYKYPSETIALRGSYLLV